VALDAKINLFDQVGLGIHKKTMEWKKEVYSSTRDNLYSKRKDYGIEKGSICMIICTANAKRYLG